MISTIALAWRITSFYFLRAFVGAFFFFNLL
jgi:hypothetical protein